MILCLRDRRVAAASRTKSVAATMEGRLIQRAQALRRRLLHDSVNHVGYAKATLSAARLGDPNPADIPGAVAAIQQLAAKRHQNVVEVLTHRGHALAVRTGGAVVGSDTPPRSLQIRLIRNLLER